MSLNHLSKKFEQTIRNNVKSIFDFNQKNIPSGSDRKYFSTQTDWFYSYQCNETIFKADS